MDRSPRFRVYPRALAALFRLAFASAPDQRPLTSRTRSNSPDHNAKGTPSPTLASGDASRAPTACMHTVSGSISLAVRRSFHLSLTVLFTIGHRLVFSLGRWSSQFQPGFHVSRPTRGPHRLAYLHFAYGTLTLYGRTFQYRSAMLRSACVMQPHNPQASHLARVWALPFSLAATPGISIDFCSSRYLDVSVPWVGSPCGVTGLLPPGSPIRISSDPSLLAAPRGFSQLATSFVAGLCQGIHHVHLFA